MASEASMLLVFFGCVLPDGAEKPSDTADTGLPTGDAYGCVEDARTPILDTTVAAEGMSFSPDAVLATVAGGWVGTFRFVSGDEQLAGFTVETGGSWEIVTRTLHDGGGLGEGAPVEECLPYYAWSTDAALSDASGAFDEAFAARIDATAADAATLSAEVPLDDLVGATRPAAWDPADWARNTLSISGTAVPGQWEVSVMWQASSEAAASAKEETGADTATVEPSGMVEGVGSGTFRPAED